MKKCICILALLLVSTANLWAQNVSTTINDIKYTLSTNGDQHTATVNGYEQTKNNVTIPAEVAYDNINYTITKIAAKAFYYCDIIDSITIPKSVTSIGENAFDNCQSLESVTFENGSNLTTIAKNAFSYTGITSITIPASVTSIGENAFYNCQSLESVTFENGSKSKNIGKGAFSETGITSITIPKSVTSIGENAFYLCTSLTSVTIEDNDQLSIFANAFLNSGLTSITIPKMVKHMNNNAFCGIPVLYYHGELEDDYETWGANCRNEEPDNDGFIYKCDNNNKPINLLAYFGKKPNIVIPASVESIANNVFFSCQSLESVTFENNSKLNKIYNYAFHNSSIKSITIPASVNYIGEYAFCNCQNLESVTFENNSTLETIEIGVFNETGIKSIKIPKSVKSIGINAFASCQRLESVTFEDNSILTKILNAAFNETNITSITIPASVTSIGNYAFEKCQNLKSVTFENNSTLKTINDNAFANSGITSITIPTSVTSIGKKAFQTCKNLKSVTFENDRNLLTIGDNAFELSAIKSISIPNSVTSIGYNAFNKIILLKYYGKAGSPTEKWGAYYRNYEPDEYDFIYTEDTQLNTKTLLAYIGNKTDIEIPTSFTSIQKRAFDNSGIKTIKIPESVTTIGDDAFKNIKLITYNGTPDNNTKTWGALCRNKEPEKDGLIYEYNKEHQPITLLAYIGNNTEVSIPASVKSIGYGAFYNCQSLESVTFADGSNLEKIEYNAFYESGITSISIPASVKSIGNSAFYNCQSLKSVTFADGSNLEKIEYSAFYESGITSISIPASVKSIGKNAFRNCNAIDYVYCYAAPESITIEDNFDDDFKPKKETIFHVKSSDKAAWKKKLPDAKVTFVYDLIDIADITISNNTAIYSGSKITPEIKVSYDKSELTLNTDYTISHGNNNYINTGEYTISVKGISNLCFGTKDVTFTIEKATPTYTTPTFETLPCNTTLASLSLTKGFAVASNNDELKIGENTVTLTYTPSDPENYNTVDNIEVKITLAHKYGTPVYTWSDDGKACTATVTCTVDQTHTVTEKATITNEVTTLATTETKGTTTYTASFKNTLFTTQTKAVEDIAALDHKYGTPVYTWSDDGKACTATVTCTVDKTLTVTEKATITNEVTTPATCEAKGTTTYTASFKNTLFTTQTKAVEDIAALGHKYGTPVYTWSDDGKACTATVTCTVDKTYTVTEKATITNEVTTPATCEAKGTTTYTASFNNTLFTTQTKAVEDIEKLPATNPGGNDNPSTPVSEINTDTDNIKVWSYANTLYILSSPDRQYKIIDINGRTIKESTTKSTREEIYIANSGIYIVIINGNTFKLKI